MHSFFFQGKENLSVSQNYSFSIPRHQGRAFKLQLGHNNGPYLAKDIMHSNNKSTYLIAARQVLQSHQSMAKLMSIINKQEQCQQKLVQKTFKVENWFSKCDFMEEEAKYMENQLKKVSNQQSRLRVQIKKCYIKFNKQNEQLQQGFLPLFKNLLRSIRDQNNQQKHLFEQRKRDIQNLNQFRNNYLDALVKCESGMVKMEKFLGISQKQIDQN